MAGGIRFCVGLSLLTSSMMFNPAAAQAGHVRAELVAGQSAVVPGGDILVGLKLMPDKGWHSYWINPGETGLAAEVTWVLPQGVTAGPVQWPTPDRFFQDGVATYGYARESTLFITLHNGSGLKAGSILRLQARADVLVCDKICVPESLDLSLELKVATVATALENPALAGLPRPLNIEARIANKGGFIDMGFVNPQGRASQNFASLRGVYAFLVNEGIVDPSAPQLLSVGVKGFSLRVKALAGSLPPVMPVVLKFADGKAWQVNLKPGSRPAGTFAVPAGISPGGLMLAMIMAFAGGIILNLMPCVFPVLSIKLLALTRAGYDKKRARGEALLYGGGVIASFLVLALALDLAHDLGASLGWGFQLQSPFVTGFLSLILLLVALNMSGLFEVGSGLQGWGGDLLTGLAGKPRLSAFMTGVLAVVIAAPCTAPFMAAAVGLALAQGGFVSFAIFTGLGLGFAAPFVALTFAITLMPGVAGRLPKPGVWMDRLRKLLALPMYAAALWMVWVFAQQVSGPENAGVAGYESFSPERIAVLRAQGTPVLVDMTAAWCVTCKVNERLVLSDAQVVGAIKQSGTIYMVGDWTQRNAVISDYLRQFGRSGVPLYVYYGRGNAQPLILPQILQRDHLINLLKSNSYKS